MFYDCLKAACIKKGVSISAAVTAVGMSKANATQWKNGQIPKLDTVIKLAKFLNIDVHELVPRDLDERKGEG